VRFLRTGLDGLWIVEDEPRVDARGSFAEAYRAEELSARGFQGPVLMVNFSESSRAGTVRGLHWQAAPFGQAKLVRCVRGAVYDVAADMRGGSPARLQHRGEALTESNGRALLVPGGFAHGWQALTDGARIMYLVGGSLWSPEHERGARHDDPALAVAWPLTASVVSDRDRSWPPATPDGGAR
jgi:dTDP-4-dehydrorhamnose 3,5-epimerase